MGSETVPAPQLRWNAAVDRRAWIASVLRTAAGVSLLQGVAKSQEHEHTHAGALPGGDHAVWTPKFLNAEQNQALIALGERIIPGSTAACCNQVIDLVMTIQSKAHQDELTGALEAFNEAAGEHGRKEFASLSPEQQDAILSSASATGSSLHTSFVVIKEWMVDTYWSSRQGMRELGWNGQMAWSSFPACPHAEDREHSAGAGGSVSLR